MKALLGGSVAVGAVIAGILAWKLLKKPKKVFTKVGTVSQLFIYPIKSCRGISVQSAECTPLGLKHGIMRDRVFLLITPDGTFVTARQEQKMLLVVSSFEDDVLLVNAPEMPTLKVPFAKFRDGTMACKIIPCKVWGQLVDGCDCGDEAAKWFQEYFGKSSYRLVHFRLDFRPKHAKERTKYQQLLEKDDFTAYADLTPYMLMNEASVKDLNTKLDQPVGMRNFRPNIVINDCPPYAEDKWKLIQTEKGVIFRNVKPCQRCILTTIDPDTAIKTSDDPLKTLKTYRQTKDPYMKQFIGESALLGVDLCIDNEGIIAVGDDVFAC